MNVCIITSWFPNKKQPNLAPFVYTFAKNLAKADVEVSVIAPNSGEDDPVSKRDSIVIYRVRMYFPIFQILNLLKQINPDIIHVHAPNFFGSLAVLAAKLRNIPLVATVHRVEVDKTRNILALFRKFVLRRFHNIIAVSNFTKSLALAAGAEEEKISVIYNSCDETIFFSKDKWLARKKCNLEPSQNIVLFVGNLVKIKGVYTFIEALRNLKESFPDFYAIVIGQGEELENLQSLVKGYALTTNVEFLGWLPQNGLSDLYSSADVLVSPSLIEGHSVAMLEAMASGLPIIASKVGGNKESIEEGINGLFFENSNEKVLAEKILTVLSDYKLKNQMSINTSELYHERFSSNTQIEKHLKLYNSLVCKGKSTSTNTPRVLLIDNQGLSHYTSYLASGLSKCNNITLYGFSREQYEITGAAAESTIKFYSVGDKFPKGRLTVVMLIKRPFLLFAILFRALNTQKYDIVHIQGHLLTFFLFIPFLKFKRKKIFWTIHDVNLRSSTQGIRGTFEVFYVNALTQPRILGKCSDIILVHGSFLRNQLISKGIAKNKVHVIPHMDYRYLLNVEGLQSEPGDKVFPNSYVLLFGRIKPYKGFDIFIHASRLARNRLGTNLNVLIAGSGDISYLKGLLKEQDFDYLRIRNEFIPDSEIATLFRMSKFVVLPYIDASQSGIIPLAYTFSKPVIVSNVGSLAEYVSHDKTGLIFEPGNTNQLAEFIIELVENDKKCILMGNDANQKLLKEMSLERSCEIINDLYNKRD